MGSIYTLVESELVVVMIVVQKLLSTEAFHCPRAPQLTKVYICDHSVLSVHNLLVLSAGVAGRSVPATAGF